MAKANDLQLSVALKELIGNSYVMYLRAHGAHWNVEGPLFSSLHDFFGKIADDVFDPIDIFAESLRQHEFYAPYTLSHVMKLSTIPDMMLPGGQPTPLLQDLIGVNGVVMESLAKVKAAAERVSPVDDGLVNHIEERRAAHLKWDWQLKAHLKTFNTDTH